MAGIIEAKKSEARIEKREVREQSETRMLDALTDKFSGVFRNLSGRGKISEENVREAMRDVRTALLEADVNFGVVKQFTETVLEKAIGAKVIESLKPGE